MEKHRAHGISRDWRLDLCRTVALFFVVSVHFLLNSGFYKEVVDGERMFIMIAIRAVTITCVPLFILLTGYLVKGSFERSYFAKLGRIMWVYVVVSLLCAANRIVMLEEKLTFFDLVRGILSFKTAKYAWYVEMYIGLFLLTPALGCLWDALPSKRERGVLLLICVAVFFLPNITNIYDLKEMPQWLNDPASSKDWDKVLPAWWVGSYPIGYYFVGRWIREYGAPLKKRALSFLWVLSTGCLVATDWWRSHGGLFIWGPWNAYNSPMVLVSSASLFALILSLDRGKAHRPICSLLGLSSKLSFGAYLSSWIWDSNIYPRLALMQPHMHLRLNWMPLVVCTSLICSLFTAWVVEMTYSAYKHIRSAVWDANQ